MQCGGLQCMLCVGECGIGVRCANVKRKRSQCTTAFMAAALPTARQECVQLRIPKLPLLRALCVTVLADIVIVKGEGIQAVLQPCEDAQGQSVTGDSCAALRSYGTCRHLDGGSNMCRVTGAQFCLLHKGWM
jgi:hypothetical protein